MAEQGPQAKLHTLSTDKSGFSCSISWLQLGKPCICDVKKEA